VGEQQRKKETIRIMAIQKAGRPSKPDQKKRQQLHISLYAEDIERLDRLTDNRSEFFRQCIAKAWEEQMESESTLAVSLPTSFVRQMRKVVDQLDPHNPAITHRTLIARRPK
jgi:hypothetical protein